MSKVTGQGTAKAPWELKTPPGTSDYQAYRDEDADPPALVVLVLVVVVEVVLEVEVEVVLVVEDVVVVVTALTGRWQMAVEAVGTTFAMKPLPASVM